jgi:hypothetical protein
MTKDHRLSAGRYGSKERRLTRDDFAGIVFTLLPVDEPPPGRSSRPAGVPEPADGVPEDVVSAARRHCLALAEAWPEEPVATLAALVARLLGRSPEAVDPKVLCAAALLCHEEAARTDTVGDRAPGSAQSVASVLDGVAGAARAEVESAFDE